MNIRLISACSILLTATLFTGCARQGETETADADTDTPTEQSVAASEPPTSAAQSEEDLKRSMPAPKITPVTINLTLSPKATEEIKRSGETILVEVIYGGDPMASAQSQTNEFDLIELGRVKKELQGAETITLSEDVINKAQLAKTIGQPQVMINATSGKKSSNANLLNCDFYWETLSKAGQAPVNIGCKLLSEG